MKVYLDNKNICHSKPKEGYREAEHPFFDTIPELAIDCYKFIPEHNFIQCVDSKKESAIVQQFNASEEKYGKVLQDIAVEIGAIVMKGVEND